MRILPIHVIPIFLSRALPGELGSQLRMFDVFYKTPPVVGWHVTGSPEECAVVGFCAQSDDPYEGSVVGFSVLEDRPAEHVAGFVVGDCDDNS